MPAIAEAPVAAPVVAIQPAAIAAAPAPVVQTPVLFNNNTIGIDTVAHLYQEAPLVSFEFQTTSDWNGTVTGVSCNNSYVTRVSSDWTTTKLKINIKNFDTPWGGTGIGGASIYSKATNYEITYGTAATMGVQNSWASYVWAGTSFVRVKDQLHWPQPSPVEQLRQKLKNNLAPTIITKNKQLWGIELTEEELRARTLLLEMIGATEFRRYLRKGFIMVIGRSGTPYKISGGHNRVVSYKKDVNGRLQPYEAFCVVFSQYDLPFTDGVIMRKLMVEHDEFALRKASNVAFVGQADKFAAPALRVG